MDRAQVWSVDNILPGEHNQADEQPSEIEKSFRNFINQFRLDNDFVYRCAVLNSDSLDPG